MPKYTEAQLLRAVKYSQQNPDISQAYRDEKLFTPGEERAIAKHYITMENHNFPISHDLLRRLAQDILNSRSQCLRSTGVGDDSIALNIVCP